MPVLKEEVKSLAQVLDEQTREGHLYSVSRKLACTLLRLRPSLRNTGGSPGHMSGTL